MSLVSAVPSTMSSINNTDNFVSTALVNDSYKAEGIDYGCPPDQLKLEMYIVPILFAMIFIVGVLGNGTLIYTVARNKNMRNVPNMFIVSLAVGDLLLIMVSVPLASSVYVLSGWHFGSVLCKLTQCVENTSLGVSVFTLVALSADRYVAIVDPMRRHRSSTTKRTATSVIAIWIGSILLAVPDTIITTVVDVSNPCMPNTYMCQVHPIQWEGWHYTQIHTMLRFFLYFAIPIVVIAIFYYLMARMLIRSTRTTTSDGSTGAGASLHSSANQRQMDTRKKVAKVVLSFVVVFIICWLPRHIYSIWFFMTPFMYNDFWHVFKIAGFCLSFINSCVNPMALYFLSNQFRSYYNRYLFCFCSRSRKPDLVTSMYNFDGCGRHSSTTVTMMAPPSHTIC